MSITTATAFGNGSATVSYGSGVECPPDPTTSTTTTTFAVSPTTAHAAELPATGGPATANAMIAVAFIATGAAFASFAGRRRRV